MNERFGRYLVVSIVDSNLPPKHIRGYDDSNGTGLRINFRVNRRLTVAGDTATVRIWNLSPQSRAQLAQRNLVLVRHTPIKYVQIVAGYRGAGNSGVIFNGAILHTVNFREGPDWITEIEANTTIAEQVLNVSGLSYDGSVRVRDILLKLFADAGYAGQVKLSDRTEQLLANFKISEFVSSGSAYESLRKLVLSLGLTYTKDVDAVNVTVPGYSIDPVTEPFLVIDEMSGMVGTPKVNTYGAQIRTLLDPRIKPGRQLSVTSQTLQSSVPDPSLGQLYTCWGVLCNGDTHADDWYSDIDARFYPPQTELSDAMGAPPQPIQTVPPGL